MKKKLRSLILVLVTVLMMTGCGGDGEGEDPFDFTGVEPKGTANNSRITGN